MRKKLAAAVISAALFGSLGQVHASSNFFADVPAESWTYTAVNELLSTGKIADYPTKIPDGRILSRLEMAMIVDEASRNVDALTSEQRSTLDRLRAEYVYDIKKLELISKLDRLDDRALEKLTDKDSIPFTQQDKDRQDKLAALADRFSFDGYARVRNDHFLKDNGSGGTTRTTRANMMHIQVASHYKVNDDWSATVDFGYRNSLSGFDKTRNLAFSDNGENDTGFKMDTYVTGKMLGDALTVKAGKWNEWNPFGWGMDIDCDFAGAQLTYGKKDFKTFLTVGKMDLWDNFMGGDRDSEEITSLRAFYPFSRKADINFGVAYTSGMESRYQDPDDRVFSYYTHAHYKFDNNWDLRAGTINGNANRADNPTAGTKTKKPGRWLQLQYKNADLQKPGSYAITADYRYEPALNWITVTDWCGLNEKFFRFGVAWVPAKNILLDTFYTWAREIDTDARNDLYRFQANLFF